MWKPPSPIANDLSIIVGGLEQAMCTRFERLESYLQRIQFKLGIDAELDEDNEGVESSAKTGSSDSHPIMGRLRQHREQGVADEAAGVEEEEEKEEEEEDDDDEEVSNKREALQISESNRHLVELGLGDLDLRPEWLNMAHQQPAEVVQVSAHNQKWSYFSKVELGFHDPDSSDKRVPWWIIQPSGRFRTCWDVTMLLLIAHDMAVIPVTLAFETGETILNQIFFWPFLIFWTVDIPITFFTGFYKNGLLEVRLRSIACHYLSTWLVLDVFMVSSSWMEFFDAMGQDGHLLGRTGKNMRFVRVIRSVRIIRLAKLRKIAAQLGDLITSEYHQILLGVVKSILLIVWLNHFIACIWWALGINISDGGRNESWTRFYKYERSSLSLQYFTSLHWSLTQFTPASMEVSARNTPERVFSVIVLLFALVAFSSFISSITAHMHHLRQLQDRHSSDFARLRRYLKSHHVPLHLGARIMYCVEYRVRRQMLQVQDSDVSFLQLLSKPLQRELKYHMFSPTLVWHPFFARCTEVDSEAVRRICAEAVSTITLAVGDLLFAEGEGCSQMFFVTIGQLRYSMGQRNQRRNTAASSGTETGSCLRRLACKNLRALSLDMLEQYLDEREWCCEVSIWCPWTHLGSMMAAKMSEVMAVDSASVIRVASSFHFIGRLATRYADLFMEKMFESLVAGEIVSDISAFDTDWLDDIVATASSRSRNTVFEPNGRGFRETFSAETVNTFNRKGSDDMFNKDSVVIDEIELPEEPPEEPPHEPLESDRSI